MAAAVLVRDVRARVAGPGSPHRTCDGGGGEEGRGCGESACAAAVETATAAAAVESALLYQGRGESKGRGTHRGRSSDSLCTARVATLSRSRAGIGAGLQFREGVGEGIPGRGLARRKEVASQRVAWCGLRPAAACPRVSSEGRPRRQRPPSGPTRPQGL